jgi:hypothetical protein
VPKPVIVDSSRLLQGVALYDLCRTTRRDHDKASNDMTAKDITIKGRKSKRGERMTSGRGYRLVTKANRVFIGTLLDTINTGTKRIAIFSVPK